jgi:hypothetical protein
VSLSGRTAAHPRTDVTWNGEVARILERRCAGCHYSGGIGPADFTDYSEARRWAQGIKRSVLDRRMPPWQASPGFGDFENDGSLTPYEVELLVAWVNGGMRVGPPPEAPVAPIRPRRAAIERTDLIVTAPANEPVTSARRTVEVNPQLSGNRWITGWEFRPENLARVRQATFFAGDVVFGTWTPLDSATVLPEGIGQRLRAGSPIRIDIRYRDAAAPFTDRSSLALQLSDKVVRESAHLDLARGKRRLSESIDALALRPTLSSMNDSVQLIAHRPDGSSEALLVVKRYDPDAAETYRFRQPVSLPAGTMVDVVSFEPDCRVDLEYVRSVAQPFPPPLAQKPHEIR